MVDWQCGIACATVTPSCLENEIAPHPQTSLATLGVYELTRVELLQDLYVWACERSAQEYLAIRQELPEPDPTRLAYRELINQTICEGATPSGRHAREEVYGVAHTMSLEDQRPADQRIQKQVARRAEELLRGKWSELWR